MGPIAGKEAIAEAQRSFVLPRVLGTEIAPVPVLVPEQKLEWHLLRGEQGVARTGGHQDLAQGELGRLLQLAGEELNAGLDQGKGVQVRIRVPGGPGPVVGVQDRLIGGKTRRVCS